MDSEKLLLMKMQTYEGVQGCSAASCISTPRKPALLSKARGRRLSHSAEQYVIWAWWKQTTALHRSCSCTNTTLVLCSLPGTKGFAQDNILGQWQGKDQNWSLSRVNWCHSTCPSHSKAHLQFLKSDFALSLLLGQGLNREELNA